MAGIPCVEGLHKCRTPVGSSKVDVNVTNSVLMQYTCADGEVQKLIERSYQVLIFTYYSQFHSNIDSSTSCTRKCLRGFSVCLGTFWSREALWAILLSLNNEIKCMDIPL